MNVWRKARILLIFFLISSAAYAADFHTGTVISTFDSGDYTYVEFEENGRKDWVATVKTAIGVGEEIRFADSQPMIDFESKPLKRKFDRIWFAAEVVKKESAPAPPDVDSDDPFVSAGAYALEGNYEKALEKYEEHISGNPSDPNGYYLKGNVYNEMQPAFPTPDPTDPESKQYREKVSKQVDAYRKAVELDPHNRLYLQALAQSLQNVHEFNESIAIYKRLALETPKDPSYSVYLGEALSAAQRYREALGAFDTALSLRKDPRTYRLRGAAKDKMGDVEGAMSDYKTGYLLDNSSKYALAPWLLRLFIREKRFDEGIAFYTKVLKTSPKVTDAYGSRGRLWAEKSQFNKAIADYNKAIGLEPDSANYYIVRSDAYVGLKKYQEAMKDAVFACKLSEFYCDFLEDLKKREARGWYWEQFATGRDPKAVYFYSRKDIVRNKGRVLVWSREEHPDDTTQTLADSDEKLSYTVARIEMNCRNRQIRHQKVTFYGADGNSQSYAFEKDDKFESIAPGTIFESLIENLCR
ncbi:tetratricopeptide repeat protein [Geomonas terrae]|uniref:Tetratricopeptide repeat protein n=1 Tax=Geomonas terrae TaxID=2562681 RepID=A0A4S1CBI6_9BACT|nr:surface-adhesin E family protein [Geomonas terrae]TGU70724.1 tetratricopeptide repeat protein [Geomonas terrae]